MINNDNVIIHGHSSQSCSPVSSSNTNNIFSIFHQNIRSLRANYDSLVIHLESFIQMPKLIFLSEIWISEQELTNYAIPGFTLYGNCNHNYRAGGVAVYIADGVDVTVTTSFSFSSADVLLVVLNLNNFKISILCIYRLQSCSINEFLFEYTQFLDDFKPKNLLILGDLNIDILQNSAIIDEYKFLMSSHGLSSDINVPTRIFGASSTCIDHVFFRSSSNATISSSINDLGITDHCAIFVCLRVNWKFVKKPVPIITSPQFRINFDLLNILLLNESWNSILNCSNISVAFEEFFRTFEHHMSQCRSPIKSSRKFTKLKPWFNKFLLLQLNIKNRLRKKWLNDNPNNPTNKSRYFRFANKLKKRIKVVKVKYYLAKFQRAHGNGKQQWSLVNEILNKDAPRNEITAVLNESHDTLTSPVDIANNFNSYFCNVVANMRQNFSNSTRVSDEHIVIDQSIQNSLFFHPISSIEVFNIINSLEDKWSTDQVGLSSAILKRCKFNIVDILCALFNRSISEGIFPDSLKIATVIPLFKKGNRLSTENYRPISLLPVISKIFEKAVKTRLVDFLNKHNYLSACQFGFRCNRGTEDALIALMNPLHEGLNNTNSVAALFVDICKAFDMVDHQLLLYKLWHIGIRGSMYNWFSSFITNRSQRVRIENCLSDSVKLAAGVPQGSVLGPLMFLIYINSVFKLNFKGKCVAFADDMAFAYDCPNYLMTVDSINHDLAILSNWLVAHKLQISPKTKVVLFNLSTYRSFADDIIFHGFDCHRNKNCTSHCMIIESVKDIKYLGLIVDCRLDWKCHIASVKNEQLWAIRKMYQLRDHCPLQVLKIFYHALIESRLRYGICCWGGTYFESIKPLIIAQKHVLRVMYFKNRRFPSWPLFVISKILPLKHLYIFKVLEIYFNISGNRNLSCHVHNLRENSVRSKLVPKFFKTHFFNYFLVTAPTIFNNLPMQFRTIESKRKFMNSIKSWLLHNESMKFLFEVIV